MDRRRVTAARDAECSDDLVVNVPRNLDSAKIETGGGNVNATGMRDVSN